MKINHKFDDNAYPCCDSYAYSDFTGNNPPLSEYNEEELKQIALKSIQEKTILKVQFINKEDYYLAENYLIRDSNDAGIYTQLYRSVYGDTACHFVYITSENENRIEIKNTTY